MNEINPKKFEPADSAEEGQPTLGSETATAEAQRALWQDIAAISGLPPFMLDGSTVSGNSPPGTH